MTEPEVIYERYNDAPFSTSTTSNWVAHVGGLPPYIRAVARGIMRSGHSESEAIQIALGVMANWIASKHTTAETKAKATEALAHWEAMKAAAHAGGGKRDGNFVGESGPSGAGLFLPAGPTPKQDKAIEKTETAKPHRFVGSDLAHCATCGEPITAVVHRKSNAAAQPIVPIGRQAAILRQDGHNPVGPPTANITDAVHADRLKDQTTPEAVHKFQGSDLVHCTKPRCGEPVTAAVHRKWRDTQQMTNTESPLPTTGIVIPDTISGKRHAGPGHAPVPTGHIKGVPSRHKTAAYVANHKNFAQVEGPLEDALRAHFGEQRQSTVNRLLGKRGLRMLKRARDEMNSRPDVPPLGDGYEEGQAAPLPNDPHDLHVSTEEPNTTTPSAQKSLASALSAEQAVDAKIQAEDAQPEAIITPEAAEAAEVTPPVAVTSISPQEIFDASFWTTKLAGVLGPHLTTAATLGTNEVKNQLGIHAQLDDTSSIGAVQAILKARAAAAAEAITGTTADDLAAALQEGVAHGEGKEEIAQRVNDVFDKADQVRARQIAQTQVVSAYNEASNTYANNLPQGVVGSKVWLSHKDSRTRPTHRLANGQEQPVNGVFYVGGSPMICPGDMTAPIGEWINCRCSMAFMPPGMTHAPMAAAAQAYVDALTAKPPTPISPYLVPA